MKVKIVSILCGVTLAVAGMQGKEPLKRRDAASAANSLHNQLIDRQVSELMANRIDIRKERFGAELAVMDYVSREELLEEEALRFPADELYGSWDTSWVNPFRSREIAFPDTFDIDCSTFVFPVANELKVTSKYGLRRRRMHRGIDLKVQVGDTIRAAFSGKVRIKSFERRGYGKYLVIRHPNGLETVYGHLSNYLVSENDIVRAGQPIALGGNTGRSTGSHLHFETRFLGQALDPGDLIDFDRGTPHNDSYVFRKGSAKSGNVYTSTSERIVYHRVKQGETLGKIALIYRTSVAELCRLNGISSTSKLRIGQSIRCGTAAAKTTGKEQKADGAAAAPVKTEAGETSAKQPPAALYHKVQEKETLNSIARQYGTTVETLCRLNSILSTDALRVGQEICYRVAKPAKKQESVTETNRAEGEAIAATPAGQAPESPPATVNPVPETQTRKAQPDTQPAENSAATVYYRVQKGDTLGAIAKRHGISVDRLCKMNSITKATVLQIGRSLRCS
ncbi:MAG: LysM peptidoglycan-binding domain-containing protein [Tannerella sp.]|jgi:murein DD-endopeptidase MepM/ murein hydrolase activator NlpD|nr:LysM peptidoglycan-binding domain-containing protein [Tannerella sp.]